MALDVIGINEENLNNLILELGNRNDTILDLFNQIEDKVINSQTFFKCESGNAFRTKFESIKAGFPQIKQNLEVYCTDLINAKTGNIEIDSTALRKAMNGAENLKDLTKKHL